MALDNTGLVARYFFDEAASGQVPTEALDGSGVGTPVNLPITYGNSLAYTEVSGNRGINSSSASGNGVIKSATLLTGNKIYDALNGSTTATLEYVVDITGYNQGGGRIFGLMNGNSGDGTFLMTGDNLGDTNAEIRVNGRVVYDVASPLGRHVIHVVLDTGQISSADRAVWYLDGVAQSNEANNLGLNETLAFATTTLVGLNRPDATRGAAGTLFYGAIYSAALTPSQIAANASELSTADDTRPATDPEVISAVEVQFTQNDANPVAQDITIPAGCTAVYMFWTFWNANSNNGLASLTLEGLAPDQTIETGTNGNAAATGVAAFYNPTTGPGRTIDVSWDTATTEGPVFNVVFVTGGDTSGWRDAGTAAATSTLPVSVALTAEVDDLIIKSDQRFDATTLPPGLTPGWTSVNTGGQNKEWFRTSYLVATAPSPAVESEDEEYSTLAAVSIRKASTAPAFDAFTYHPVSFNAIGSFTHTPVGQPRGVVVAFVTNDVSDQSSLLTLTYGGEPMILASSEGNVAMDSRMYIYFLGEGIPGGPQLVDFSGTSSAGKRVCVWTLTADHDLFVADIAELTGNSADPSFILDAGGLNSFCCQVSNWQNTPTEYANWTENQEFNGEYSWHSYDLISDVPVTGGYTMATGQHVFAAVAISEVISPTIVFGGFGA